MLVTTLQVINDLDFDISDPYCLNTFRKKLRYKVDSHNGVTMTMAADAPSLAAVSMTSNQLTNQV